MIRKTLATLFCLAIPSVGSAAISFDDNRFDYGLTGYVEAGGIYQNLTGGQENWKGVYSRASIQQDYQNIWNYELRDESRFGDTGIYGALGNTHIWNEKWYSMVSVASSSGGFFFPRYRTDAALYRKWGADNRFITNLGVGLYKSKDVFEDQSLSLGATYYFTQPWILEGGLKFNNSSPGSVDSLSEYIALTQGTAKNYYVTVRFGAGTESYQIINSNSAIVDFESHEVSVNYRKWLSDNWGFNITGEHYHNPFYERHGVVLGLFRDF